MTALADIKDVRRQPGEILAFPVEEAVKIYEGALVMVNAAGYAVPGADTTNCFFVGVADETVDNTSGADGAKVVKVRTNGVITVASAASLTQANNMDTVYLADDQTVDLAANVTNDLIVGKIVEVVSASKARVALASLGR